MSHFEDLFNRKPVDIVAARVTWAAEAYEPEKILNQEIWQDGPPPTIDPDPRWCDDLRGTSRGRMTIVGYLDKANLLARCVCGNYERRDTKSWRKGVKNTTHDLGCQICRHLNHIRRIDHKRRTGIWPDAES